jgi:hypothetical protein
MPKHFAKKAATGCPRNRSEGPGRYFGHRESKAAAGLFPLHFQLLSSRIAGKIIHGRVTPARLNASVLMCSAVLCMGSAWGLARSAAYLPRVLTAIAEDELILARDARLAGGYGKEFRQSGVPLPLLSTSYGLTVRNRSPAYTSPLTVYAH